MPHTTVRHRLLALAVLALLSLVYAVAAYELLSPIIANIGFTTKEIKGAGDYRVVRAWLFDLHNGAQAPKAIARALSDEAQKRGQPVWLGAAQSLDERGTLSVAQLDDVLRGLIRAIGDESNLILDPVISTYYAAAFLLNDVPMYLNRVSRVDAGDARDLATHFQNTDHALHQICGEETPACAALRQNILSLKHVLLGDQGQSLADASTYLAAAAQAVFDMLESRLHQRLEAYMFERNRLVAIIAIFYITLVSLLVFSLKNYASQKEIALGRERQQLAVMLQQKNTELESFAHAAAHDLKEPVRTMSCYAMLLSKEYGAGLDPAARDYTSVIERTAKRAERMINDLLAYARMSEKPLQSERCDTAKEVEAVLEDLKNHIDAVGPQIALSDLPTIATVPSMFRRVMANLIDNALKYRDPVRPLRVSISARREEKLWVFTVADNGMGIAEQHRAAVFEPFRRLYPEIYKDGQGIGLTACKKIVERLGGRIWIASNADGGASVSFALPVKT